MQTNNLIKRPFSIQLMAAIVTASTLPNDELFNLLSAIGSDQSGVKNRAEWQTAVATVINRRFPKETKQERFN